VHLNQLLQQRVLLTIACLAESKENEKVRRTSSENRLRKKHLPSEVYLNFAEMLFYPRLILSRACWVLGLLAALAHDATSRKTSE
jgi:hypothetical protein